MNPRVYADFHNADAQGRLRLNCVGTVEDLARLGVDLREGLQLTLYSDDLDAHGQPDDLVANGIVSFAEEEHCWVAVINWDAIQHASDAISDSPQNGNRLRPHSAETPAQ